MRTKPAFPVAILVSAIVLANAASGQESEITAPRHDERKAFTPVVALSPLDTTIVAPREDIRRLADTPPSGPALTRVAVFAVASTNTDGVWEYMSTTGQALTGLEHGGARLRVVVEEVGSGSKAVAYMNGALLPASALYDLQPFCLVGGRYTTRCPNGSAMVGNYRYYNLDGHATPGEFTFQDTSTNPSNDTLYTQIYVK